MDFYGLRHSMTGRLTMHVKANIKIASRYLLPLEVYMAVAMIGWGLAGGVIDGTLWQALDSTDSAGSWIDSNFWWAVGLCTVGILQLVASGVELITGRRWEPRLIFLSVSMRCVCAFASTIAWICVAYQVLITPALHPIVSLWIQAPLSIIFNAVAYGGNLKVRSVLDAKKNTTNLEERILHKRRNLIPLFRKHQ